MFNRRCAGVTGSITSTVDNSLTTRGARSDLIMRPRFSRPSGVPLTNSSPKPPAPMIEHVFFENNRSGRWLFATAFEITFTRSGMPPTRLVMTGVTALWIALTWVKRLFLYAAVTDRNGLG